MDLSIKTEVLSDGSKVYNVDIIEDDEVKVTFHAVDYESATRLRTALETLTVDFGDHLDNFYSNAPSIPAYAAI